MKSFSYDRTYLPIALHLSDIHLISCAMSLVSGPGRGGSTGASLPEDLELYIDKHVKYIQSLDTVSQYFCDSVTLPLI